jgi:hypothetical protein
VEDERLYRAITSLTLGIPLAFAVSAGAERHRLPAVFAWVVTAVLLAAHYASAEWQTTTAFFYRSAELVVAAHLLVAFLPYVGRGRADGFWAYNESLFTRAVTAIIFSVVLFVGLAVGLLTVRYLLGVEVEPQAFGYLFIAVVFGFNTWFFLAGVPDPLPDAAPDDVPHALAIFTQRLLMPLVVMYLAILYAYVAKIALARAWPEGTVGYLVSGFAALGILTLLLVDPVRDAPTRPWVRTFARAFYPALLPLVVLLLLATWRRIDEYGVTERRYFLLTFGLWLGAMAGYFGVVRGRDVRVVPITLCVGILATIAGPWGAYEVSRRDQLDRLTRLLTERHLLADARLVRATSPVDRATRGEISSILDYLVELHGRDVSPWIEAAGRDLEPIGAVVPTPARIMAAMGLDYVPAYERGRSGGRADRIFWRAVDPQPVSLDGYHGMVKIGFIATGDTTTFQWDDTRIVVALPDRRSIRLEVGDANATATFDELVARLRASGKVGQNEVPATEFRVDLDGDGLRARLLVAELVGRLEDDGVHVERITGDVLFVRTRPGR